MKIIGTKCEVESLLSALPRTADNQPAIPPNGWISTYRGITIEIEVTQGKHPSPCIFCMYNPPSSCDGKPCSMCPACAIQE